MRHTVVWRRDAEAELATAWLVARDRRAFTAAVEELEQALSRDPHRLGESRRSPLRRVVFLAPLGLLFDIIPDDRKVMVLAVLSG